MIIPSINYFKFNESFPIANTKVGIMILSLDYCSMHGSYYHWGNAIIRVDNLGR